ncbi:MAG: DUF969 domain-containing protein [Opitutae bacterium]|nr:DUF969 domain-containing protein [Opitutae bacterium]
MIKLIGILVVALGFALGFNTLLVVMAAGIVTGLVAGMSFHEILELFGSYFVENRYMTLPIVLMVPLIGLLERHGLQERAETLIRRAGKATAGRVILLYTLVRQSTIALGVRIGGHAEAVRPLIVPMAEAAAKLQLEKAAQQKSGKTLAGGLELPEKTTQAIRANAAAAENVGNFFGEDVFIAVGAILLMKGFFEAQGLTVSVWAMALWGIPTALCASLVMWWRTRGLDRRITRDIAEAVQTKREEAR